MSAVLVWFRRDLRLEDNPALSSAVSLGLPVVPVYVHAPDEEGEWSPGAASRWWLDRSLREIEASLAACGAKLVVRRGPSAKALDEVIRETKAKAVYWNRLYDPELTARDTRIKSDLVHRGIKAESFNGSLLFEPWEIKNLSGRPFQVYSAFAKAALKIGVNQETSPAPRKIAGPESSPSSIGIDALGLEPRLDWAKGFGERFRPGEKGGHAALSSFAKKAVDGYAKGRDLPAEVGTSRLSPHLHFGELSVRAVWASLSGRRGVGVETYRKELLWREFAHHLLFHFPHTPNEPLRGEFRSFPWREDAPGLKAWQKGLTGYPIVDAGLRELWATGWMHNRVRMIVASFLVKDLRISWLEGARWFWDTLVDADLANNTLGWQWTAGCGADAAPYFRVFNPVLQGGKFDPRGDYVRAWVPELVALPEKWIHRPWEAPGDVLAKAGVALGKTYPAPVVDHARARLDALAAFKTLKS
jgi:deoxyribodipyrimidine photo-lyase